MQGHLFYKLLFGLLRLQQYTWVFRLSSHLALVKVKGVFETSPMYFSVQLPLGKLVCNKMSSLKYSSVSLTHSWKTATWAMKHDSCSEAYLFMLFSSLGYDTLSISALMELLVKCILICTQRRILWHIAIRWSIAITHFFFHDHQIHNSIDKQKNNQSGSSGCMPQSPHMYYIWCH